MEAHVSLRRKRWKRIVLKEFQYISTYFYKTCSAVVNGWWMMDDGWSYHTVGTHVLYLMDVVISEGKPCRACSAKCIQYQWGGRDLHQPLARRSRSHHLRESLIFWNWWKRRSTLYKNLVYSNNISSSMMHADLHGGRWRDHPDCNSNCCYDRQLSFAIIHLWPRKNRILQEHKLFLAVPLSPCNGMNVAEACTRHEDLPFLLMEERSCRLVSLHAVTLF